MCRCQCENHRYIRATIPFDFRRCYNKAEALIYRDGVETGGDFKKARITITGLKSVIAQVLAS